MSECADLSRTRLAARHARACTALAAFIAASCSTKREQPLASDPPVAVREAAQPRPASRMWTRSFLEKTVLSAGEVEIEGPELLRERLALRRDEFNHEHTERAVDGGYLIESRQRDDSDGSPIRAQLDELVIDAYERITVRIRPQAERVVLRASGDVFVFVVATGRETRSATLTLVGELDTPLGP